MSNAPYPWEGTMQHWLDREVPRKVTEGKWRLEPGFICRTCQEMAYLHPFTNRIWGCKKCEYSTASPSIFFQSVK